MAHHSCGTPVGPTLQIRAQWHQTTVRARGGQDVTTHAPLRSQWAKAISVYHVRDLGDGDAPTSLIKDTRLLGVGSRAMLGDLVPGYCYTPKINPSPFSRRPPSAPAHLCGGDAAG